MASLTECKTYDASILQLNELLALRPQFSKHNSVRGGIDWAIKNVFELSNHNAIRIYIGKVKDLAPVLQTLEACGACVSLARPVLHTYEAQTFGTERVAQLKKMIDLRNQIEALGLTTGGIDAAIVSRFEVNLSILHHYCSD